MLKKNTISFISFVHSFIYSSKQVKKWLNIFKDFSSYKKFEDNYKNNVEKNQFETPRRYSFKNSDKTQDNETIIIQNRYEVVSDSDESDTNGSNNGVTN